MPWSFFRAFLIPPERARFLWEYPPEAEDPRSTLMGVAHGLPPFELRSLAILLFRAYADANFPVFFPRTFPCADLTDPPRVWYTSRYERIFLQGPSTAYDGRSSQANVFGGTYLHLE